VKSWEEKSEGSRLLWRGQTTGVWFDRQTNWRKSHRVRLHRLGVAPHHQYGKDLRRRLRTPGLLLPDPPQLSNNRSAHYHDRQVVVVVEKEYSLAQLADRYLSASFVGDLVQCTVEDSSCEAIAKEIEFAEPVDWQFQNNFKVTPCHSLFPKADLAEISMNMMADPERARGWGGVWFWWT
jgi:hypothetical protein